MSVEIYDIGCSNETGGIYLPVSSERIFEAVWEPALRKLQIRRLGNGVWLQKHDLEGILEDFQRVREWAKQELDRETAAYLEKRINFILQELPEKWGQCPDMEQLWMG